MINAENERSARPKVSVLGGQSSSCVGTARLQRPPLAPVGTGALPVQHLNSVSASFTEKISTPLNMRGFCVPASEVGTVPWLHFAAHTSGPLR